MFSKKSLIYFFVSLIIFPIIDTVWLGMITKDLYHQEIDSLMRADFNWPSVLMVYILLSFGLCYFIFPNQKKPRQRLLSGALLGWMTYGVYDFTNLATLNSWTLKISLADMAWGGVICALVSFLTPFICEKLLPKHTR